MRIASLTFDDGLRRSCLKAAEIFERFELSASFNVIATGHLPSFRPPDKYHRWPRGDFGLWNELKSRGHEIMPHGYDHTDKSKIPFDAAKAKVERCLEMFSTNLVGFESQQAIFHYPNNRSTPELNAWILDRVRAYCELGRAINPLPNALTRVVAASSWGPHPCDHDLDYQVDDLFDRESGWLVYNLHGLDEEGWGPIGSDCLKETLERLLQNNVRVLSPSQALDLGAECLLENS